MMTMLVIVISVALGFSWGIQHEKKRLQKQIRKHGDLKRHEIIDKMIEFDEDDNGEDR